MHNGGSGGVNSVYKWILTACDWPKIKPWKWKNHWKNKDINCSMILFFCCYCSVNSVENEMIEFSTTNN